jgi:T-complex protein 1 subunit eta
MHLKELLHAADHLCDVVFFAGQIEGKNAEEHRQLLEKCAATALSSKLVSQQKGFFAKMVVDAVLSLDELLPLNMIGVKKVPGGAVEVSALIF